MKEIKIDISPTSFPGQFVSDAEKPLKSMGYK
jgi:hypothetical protein